MEISKLKTPETLREMLDILDEALLHRGYNNELWRVLTALRGPDNNHDETKRTTTAVIRSVAFPKVASSAKLGLNGMYAIGGMAMFAKDSEESAECRNYVNPGHFLAHACAAFDALGLSWGIANKE